MGLVSLVPKLFNYTKRAVKVYPSVVFGDGAHTFVNAAKNAPLKDALKAGGKAVEAQVAAQKALKGSFLKQAWASLKSAPKVIGTSTKAGYRAASMAGKGFFGKLAGATKGLFKGIGKKMPLIGNILLVASYIPNIVTATKEQGIGQGVKETLKSAAGLGGAAIGAAIGSAICPGIGSLIGWFAGEWLTSKVVGKSYTEKKAEAEEKAQEELAQLQQQQTSSQIPFMGANPYASNPYAGNPLYDTTNPYANDIMMQQVKFNTLA